MKFLFLLFASLSLHTAAAQPFTYPTLAPTAKTHTGFVPQNWKLLDHAAGDLNKDKIPDYAMVLEYNRYITAYEYTSYDTLKTVSKPRILAIAFGKKDGTYALAQTSNTFILTSDTLDYMDDPFSDITIAGGVLKIEFQLFHTMGSWYVTNTKYIFRYQDQQFALIGADNNSFHRATHDYEDYSFNFSTKKWSLTTGSDNSAQKPVVKWHTLSLPRLQNLKTFVKPYTWEMTKGIYL